MPVPRLSFEFFPPRSLAASFRLWDCVQTLAPLAPDFVSVTYGAGGTTRTLTHEAVTAIQTTTDLNVAAHITCVDASRDETLEVARSYAESGVTSLVALRGDPSGDDTTFQPRPDGFANSIELIEALAGMGRFDIQVGAYPERHPEAVSDGADVAWLKRKIDAGASGAITQFFFEAETFLRFRDACAAAGIDAPIVPGILPIENFEKAANFATRCGARVPTELAMAFRNAQAQGCTDLLAVAQASELCSDLIAEGVEHLHFYTLNKPELTRDVAAALGVTVKQPLRKVA